MRNVFAAARDAETIEWIRSVHAHTRHTTSVCTGSLVLGAAGVLSGKRATTHRAAAPVLAAHGATTTPERVVEQVRIVTAAGVSSGIDMALRLAARLTDERTARPVQLGIEYDPQPPFDAGSPEKAGEDIVALARQVLAPS